MGTVNDGVRRNVESGVIPAWLIKKYLNKWISSSYDLFGTDNSSSAHWAYVWGIKGRYDEPKNAQDAKLDDLNDYNRNLYHDEVAGLIERFNSVLKPGEPMLYAPDIKFNRAIGRYARQKLDRKSTRLNSSHVRISYAVFCLKKKITYTTLVSMATSSPASTR